ncbi:hypothetical protein [Agrobacterium pusense]|uniref:hypothetical protein n=1 Tax=Agrobacterium pusense TaxID=648995 RepID=UPI000D1C085B|nr:hypothetical protein [Agrobacterium pusense]
MTKVVNSSEYSTNSIFVGCSVNEDGEPLVEVNRKAIGTVAGLLDFLGKYEGQQKATVNVKWAVSAVPDGFLGPRDYKIAPAYRTAALLMDVPASTEATPIVLKASELYAGGAKVKTLDELSSHLANVDIKDAHIGPLSAGATNIEGADRDAVARLQRELDDLKASLPRRVEEAIKSASIRNVRHHL